MCMHIHLSWNFHSSFACQWRRDMGVNKLIGGDILLVSLQCQVLTTFIIGTLSIQEGEGKRKSVQYYKETHIKEREVTWKWRWKQVKWVTVITHGVVRTTLIHSRSFPCHEQEKSTMSHSREWPFPTLLVFFPTLSISLSFSPSWNVCLIPFLSLIYLLCQVPLDFVHPYFGSMKWNQHEYFYIVL